jgi:hypothetical protein
MADTEKGQWLAIIKSPSRQGLLGTALLFHDVQLLLLLCSCSSAVQQPLQQRLPQRLPRIGIGTPRYLPRAHGAAHVSCCPLRDMGISPACILLRRTAMYLP